MQGKVHLAAGVQTWIFA